MNRWARSIANRFGFRIVRYSRMPKGDLTAALAGLAARGFVPAHIVDVGANRGRWSAKAARVFPQASFTLIEPQAEMVRHLDAFCRRHGGARWIEAGAGAAAGEAALSVAPDHATSTFVLSAEQSAAHGHERRRVPVVTLDHVASDVIEAIPDLVKIDAEGWETQIIEGADTLMGKTEIFLLEAHLFGPPNNPSRLARLVALMQARGYAVYDFTHFMRRPHDGAVWACEIAFAREDGFLRAHKRWDD